MKCCGNAPKPNGAIINPSLRFYSYY
jgi:hypothetical protein